jgi:prolyl-tRNA synthetase
VEVGHCFSLGQTYSRAFDLKGSTGEHVWMACQGVGTTRLLAVLLNARRQERRLWGDSSFCTLDHVIVGVGQQASTHARARALYATLSARGQRVLLEDRYQRAGQSLSASEMVGARYRWVVSDRLGELQVERTELATGATQIMDLASVGSSS